MFTACNNNGSQNTDNTTDEDTIEIVDLTIEEKPEPLGEPVVYRYGIGNGLQLGIALDNLPEQVEGLYDKIELRKEKIDEDVPYTDVLFTLGGKEVMKGGVDVGHLGSLTITSDIVFLRSGDKEWRVGDKPDGLNFNNEAQIYEQDGVIVNIDTKGRISSFVIGF